MLAVCTHCDLKSSMTQFFLCLHPLSPSEVWMQLVPVTGPLPVGSPFSIDVLLCQATPPKVHLPEASPTPSVSRPEAGLPAGFQVY